MFFQRFKKWICGFLLISCLSSQAHADPVREFIMSCTYGVLAGTLAGAASLAFSSDPGGSLNNVARGASLGLYAGVFLGLYIVFVIPNPEEQAIDQQTQPNSSLPKLRSQKLVYRPTPLPRMLVAPTFSA